MIGHAIATLVIAILTGACGWSAGRARGAIDALGLALNERDYLRGKIARVEGEPPKPPPPPPAEKARAPVLVDLVDKLRGGEGP